MHLHQRRDGRKGRDKLRKIPFHQQRGDRTLGADHERTALSGAGGSAVLSAGKQVFVRLLYESGAFRSLKSIGKSQLYERLPQIRERDVRILGRPCRVNRRDYFLSGAEKPLNLGNLILFGFRVLRTDQSTFLTQDATDPS